MTEPSLEFSQHHYVNGMVVQGLEDLFETLRKIEKTGKTRLSFENVSPPRTSVLEAATDLKNVTARAAFNIAHHHRIRPEAKRDQETRADALQRIERNANGIRRISPEDGELYLRIASIAHHAEAAYQADWNKFTIQQAIDSLREVVEPVRTLLSAQQILDHDLVALEPEKKEPRKPRASAKIKHPAVDCTAPAPTPVATPTPMPTAPAEQQL